MMTLIFVVFIASARIDEREMRVRKTQACDSRSCRATALGCLIKNGRRKRLPYNFRAESTVRSNTVTAVAGRGSSTATATGTTRLRRIGLNRSAQIISQRTQIGRAHV